MRRFLPKTHNTKLKPFTAKDHRIRRRVEDYRLRLAVEGVCSGGVIHECGQHTERDGD